MNMFFNKGSIKLPLFFFLMNPPPLSIYYINERDLYRFLKLLKWDNKRNKTPPQRRGLL
jgi:hypothetical protein